ncbi:MAG: hypothetical protein M0P31_01665 [Solirubrobacteraceae bacterium]|nr:hypothetical protein [Solirubrobacteraceae bacterium]
MVPSPADPGRAGRRLTSLLATLALLLAVTGCAAGYGDPITVSDAGADAGPVVGTPVDPGATGTPSAGETTATPPTSDPDPDQDGDRGSDGGTTTDDDAPSGSTRTTTGGSGSAYANAVQLYCRGFREAGQQFGEAYLAAGTDLPRIGAAITAFGSDVDEASRALRAIPPPARYRGFHRTALAGIERLTSAIGDNASRLRAGDVDAGVAVFREIQAASQALVSFPAAILREAPSCRALTARG